MTIQEIEEKFKAILDAAHQYSVLYEKEKDKFPYRLNVIKELHDDENAHSRILIRLLQYKDGNDYVWLRFFINRMNDCCEDGVNIEISNPSIDTEHSTGDGRIDGLILEEGKYAIIIENKIWDAVDQNEQIDKYVKYVNQQRDVDTKSIFVIYLTRNGSKVVSKDSLSEETKKTLGNHFLPMSFQYDILPWLEEDVLPNCKIKEKCLETAVYQYIDYLKGLFGQLNYQKQAQKNALKQILKDMGISEEYNEISKKHDEVQQLANALFECKTELGKRVADKFQQLTRGFFNETNSREDFVFIDNNQINEKYNYYQIYTEAWSHAQPYYKKCSHHLEWFPISYSDLFNGNKLTFVLHIERWNGTQEECNKYAESLLDKAKGKYNYIQKYDERTFFKKDYEIPNGKTFASMTEDEQRAFLKDVYSSEEIQTIIGLVNETIEEMKQQQ